MGQTQRGLLARLLLELKQSRNVLTDHIEFQIYFSSNSVLLKAGVLIGVGDDRYTESIFSGVNNGQTDAVHCDGPLFNGDG